MGLSSPNSEMSLIRSREMDETLNAQVVSIDQLLATDAFVVNDGISVCQLYAGGCMPWPTSNPAGLAGGKDIPAWFQGDGVIGKGIQVFRDREKYVLPESGVVISKAGQVNKITFHHAKFAYKDVRNLKFHGPAQILEISEKVKIKHDSDDQSDIVFNPPHKVSEFENVVMFTPWGSNINYGHFILDALPTVTVFGKYLKDINWTFISPPLLDWHREFLRILSLKYKNIIFVELKDDIIKAKTIYYTDCMLGFLHQSNDILNYLRDDVSSMPVVNLSRADRFVRAFKASPIAGVRSAVGSAVACIRSLLSTKRRLFLVRDNRKRAFLNQTQVAARLGLSGFEVVAPQNYSVAQQKEMFENAEMIVAASGAALANLIFCRPGTIVFEIMPSLDRHIWIRSTCANLGLIWAPFFVDSHSVSDQTELNGVPGKDVGIAFHVDYPELIRHIRRTSNAVKKERDKLLSSRFQRVG
jgi:capsular polysaccharide biosynthesis protein